MRFFTKTIEKFTICYQASKYKKLAPDSFIKFDNFRQYFFTQNAIKFCSFCGFTFWTPQELFSGTLKQHCTPRREARMCHALRFWHWEPLLLRRHRIIPIPFVDLVFTNWMYNENDKRILHTIYLVPWILFLSIFHPPSGLLHVLQIH